MMEGMLGFFRRKYVLISIFAFIIITMVGIFLYFYSPFPSETKNDKQARSEAKVLYDKVGKHFVLPIDELPTIATVTDPDKLQGQAFFVKAKKGDKVLIFTNAKEAILYDPTLDKVVAVAPLNIDENQIQESSGTTNSLNNF